MKEKKLKKKKKEQGNAPPAEIIVPLPKGEVTEQSTEDSAPSQTSNIPPQTENMEVHKHPHHVTHKKKWGEYLLEFLMLFLAVFLGFIAENIRESSVERHREKDYIKGIIQNLKDDTTQLRMIIPILSRQRKQLDSIVKMSKTDLLKPENLKQITKLAWGVIFYSTFTANTATISQLKAGNLRLIQRNHASDSILKYDLMNELTKMHWGVYFYTISRYHEHTEVFDNTILLDSSYSSYYSGVTDGKLPPPVSYDKEKLRNYFNSAVGYFFACAGYENLLKKQLNYAKRLIAYLKKEYHLEND